MRIGYVCVYFHPVVGGGEAYVMSLAKRMVARGHEVTVHTSSANPGTPDRLRREEVFSGIRIRRYRMLPTYLFVPRLNGEEVVHLNAFGPTYYWLQVLLNGHRIVATPQGEEFVSFRKVRNRLFGRQLLSRVVMNIAQTNLERDFIVRNYCVDPRKVVVIPPGVDDECFGVVPDAEALSEFPDLTRHPYIVSVGRVVPQKHFEIGIHALSLLHKDVRYVVVGPLQDRRTYDWLLDTARRLNVADRVVFTGLLPVHSKRLLLAGASSLLVPGDESFSMVAAEGMAAGVPVVAANHLALPEVVQDGVTGFLFEYGSPRSAAERLKLVITSESLRREMGVNGRKVAWANYRWETIAETIERIYRTVLR